MPRAGVWLCLILRQIIAVIIVQIEFRDVSLSGFKAVVWRMTISRSEI